MGINAEYMGTSVRTSPSERTASQTPTIKMAELGLKKKEIDAINFAFDVYDFKGDGKVDAFYAGDLIRAYNLNPTLKTIKERRTYFGLYSNFYTVQIFLEVFLIFLVHYSSLLLSACQQRHAGNLRYIKGRLQDKQRLHAALRVDYLLL